MPEPQRGDRVGASLAEQGPMTIGGVIQAFVLGPLLMAGGLPVLRSEKVCPFGRRVAALLTVGGLLATGMVFGDTLQSRDGLCLQSFVNEGPFNLHYNIAMYYYVRCFWDRPAVCGNGSCEPGETWSSCSLDCPRAYTCGDGTCEWEWGETSLNCYQDCGPQVLP